MFPTSEFSARFRLTQQRHLLAKMGNAASHRYRHITTSFAPTSPRHPLQSKVSQPLMEAVLGWLTANAAATRLSRASADMRFSAHLKLRAVRLPILLVTARDPRAAFSRASEDCRAHL